MNRVHLGLIAAAVMTSGCGGGGNNSFSGTDPVSDSFGIDSGNGVTAALLSYEAVLASGGIAEVGGALGISSAPTDGSAIAYQGTAPEDLVVIDAANVRVEIDSNGDGDAEEIINLTWDEFLNPGP